MTPEEITEARKLADRRYCSDSTACDAVTAALSRALDALEEARREADASSEIALKASMSADEYKRAANTLSAQFVAETYKTKDTQEKLARAVEHSTEMESRQWSAIARAEAAESLAAKRGKVLTSLLENFERHPDLELDGNGVSTLEAEARAALSTTSEGTDNG